MSGLLSVRVVGARLWHQAIATLITDLPTMQAVVDTTSWSADQVAVLLGLDVPEVQAYLKKHGGERCVLITNDHEMRQPAFRQVEVSVFVGDQDDASILHDAVRQAAQNISFCSPSLINTLICVARQHSGSTPEIVLTAPLISETLSTREREVVGHALEGWGNEQIAAHLHISISTVKFHLFNAYRKLGVSRRAQLRGVLLRHREIIPGQSQPKL